MSERVALRHATAKIDDCFKSRGTALPEQKKVVVVYYYKVPTSIRPLYTVQPVQSIVADVI